ncbi:hypothetical protein HIM_09683 [Hirsutella minnesotensis 3608]|uniref:NAD-dependent epimerase/dehydratase domain-containing protein n=1 Tax=Hirsutella minnesotensis 3608 TaxID=1043627 RepID=A0A0F7ZXL5_9HYPO|nr:hypothetical protein HIM_09683 [Hirsutella minnesotensis 3608]
MTPELIFITGATGFIGSHVANVALAAGYRVRLSIRRPEQAEEIQRWLVGPEEDVETVVIPSMSNVEAFKDALLGVDYIFHLASPMPGKGEDVRTDYVDPAVSATVAILEAALQHTSIKTVIVESSILALLPVGGSSMPPVIPRANTNERHLINLDMAFPSGFHGHGLKYGISKIAAHQATRDFRQQRAPPFKLLTFHPAYVLGDSLVQADAESISGMNAQFWNSLTQPKPSIPGEWVHVRDVADAHVRAIQHSSDIADGTEFILAAPGTSWQHAVDCVRLWYPRLHVALQPPFPQSWVIDTQPADKLLRMSWRSGDAIIRDVVEQQLALQKST